MSHVTVSVIIPNYNDAPSLPKTLDSILSQSRLPDELLIIDDGSTDNSMEILGKYAQKHSCIRLLTNGRNRGLSFTFSRLLREARCDYIWCQSANDYLLPDSIRATTCQAEAHPELGVIWGRTELSDPEDHIWGCTEPKAVKNNEILSGKDFIQRVFAIEGPYFCETCSSLIKKEAWLSLGDFDFSYADGFIWQMLNTKYGGMYLDQPFMHFRFALKRKQLQIDSTMEQLLVLWAQFCLRLCQEPLNRIAPEEFQHAFFNQGADLLVKQWTVNDEKRCRHKIQKLVGRFGIPSPLVTATLTAFHIIPTPQKRKEIVRQAQQTCRHWVREAFDKAKTPVPSALHAAIDGY